MLNIFYWSITFNVQCSVECELMENLWLSPSPGKCWLMFFFLWPSVVINAKNHFIYESNWFSSGFMCNENNFRWLFWYICVSFELFNGWLTPTTYLIFTFLISTLIEFEKKFKNRSNATMTDWELYTEKFSLRIKRMGAHFYIDSYWSKEGGAQSSNHNKTSEMNSLSDGYST